MSVLDQTRFVERIRFFDGQRLFASDLQALEAFNREMRWLHNRSLHQPGIGNGFPIYGAKSSREVRIGPGYAIDALGREIVLTAEEVEPVPPVAGEPDGSPAKFFLTVSYPANDALDPTQTRRGICLPAGAIRLRERPVLCWVRLEYDPERQRYLAPPHEAMQIVEGYKIVLGEATVQECSLVEAISVSQRRSARPSAIPRIACGREDFVVDSTSIVGPAPSLLSIGGIDILQLDVAIDVTSYGFCVPPCVHARVDMAAVFTSVGITATASVASATTSTFPVSIVVSQILPVVSSLGATALDGESITINWLAIEG